MIEKRLWRGSGIPSDHTPSADVAVEGWQVMPVQNTAVTSRDWRFTRRVVITVAIVALAYLLWWASAVFLLIFASMLFAVVFSAAANWFSRLAGIRYGLALFAVTLCVLLGIAAFALLLGGRIGSQIADLAVQLPSAIDNLGNRFGVADAYDQLREALSSISGATMLSRAAGIGFVVIGVLLNVVLVVIAGLYLAADPQLYRRGASKLLRPDKRASFIRTIDAVARSLRYWVLGQLIAMGLVGILSGIIYGWIGLPAPLALGAIAAVANVVPYVGPVVAAVPALAFAFSMDMNTVLWTAGAVLLIQQLEGNLITPLVQRRTVKLPPAVVLFSIVLFGSTFGFLGVFLAVPITVTIFVLVQDTWLQEETEGERRVRKEPA